MTLLQAMDIASSGMSAQTVRLNTTASNLANVDSVGGDAKSTYRARMPVFAATMENYRNKDLYGVQDDLSSLQGVSVDGVVEKAGELQKEYSPEHPKANADGYIFRPNVNPMEELANMISASRSYQLNVEVADTAKTMALKTLTLGQ